ncbi:MAG: hypothetical protein AAB448_04550 [Patescibacteria group bacterium]
MKTSQPRDPKKGKSGHSLLFLAAAVAAVAAGTYYFKSAKGKKHRAMLKGWAVQAKGEVLDRIEQMKEMGAEDYLKIVDDVLGKYKATKKISTQELWDLGQELKSNWKSIAKDLGGKKKAKASARKKRTKKSSK